MNITPFNISENIISAPEQIHFSEVLQNFCNQVDEKLLLGAFFILSYFIFKNFILPKAYDGLFHYFIGTDYDWILTDYINIGYERALSLLETFAMGSSLFLISIFYYQNSFPVWMWVFLIIYSIFLGSYIISYLIGKIRKRFSK